jgi:hypothetical protein
MNRFFWVLIGAISVLLSGSIALASEGSTPAADVMQTTEEQGFNFWENGRIAFDFSSRIDAATEDGDLDGQLAIGLDTYKVFSNKSGDIGVFIGQIYGVRLIDKERPFPYIFEEGDDWALQMRVIEFDYRQLSNGIFNIRVGHVFVPYGLRRDVNQTGTLRQLIMGPNLGFKVDFGVSVHGAHPFFEYEMGVYRGSGLEYHDDGDPYLVSGRVASSGQNNVIVGLSGLHGNMWTPKGIVERTRFGIDGQAFLGPVNLLTEISYGKNPKDTDILNGIFELGVPLLDGSIFTYGQGVMFMKTVEDTWKNKTGANAGVRWIPINDLFVELQYDEAFTAFGGDIPSSQVKAQIRFRVN